MCAKLSATVGGGGGQISLNLLCAAQEQSGLSHSHEVIAHLKCINSSHMIFRQFYTKTFYCISSPGMDEYTQGSKLSEIPANTRL